MLTRAAFSVGLGALLLLPALLSGPGCSLGGPGTRAGGAAEAPDVARLHAVLINGGGQRETNYHSHLDHLRILVELLTRAGVNPDRISIFSADGADPEPDLATRQGRLHADLWLLPKQIAARLLRPRFVYVDSDIAGFTLQPAKRRAIQAWFEQRGRRLGRGDTLLFYVTDHGKKKSEDLSENTITLWGEELSVGDLRALFLSLDPAVRVVMLMSQCFSGAFAQLIASEPGDRLPAGNVCGYFAATGRRKAYGCYPEVSGRKDVGHSYRVFEALDRLGRLPDANREALLTDRTPDVPHTTSGLFLEERLERAAARAGRERRAWIDELLAAAWQQPEVWGRDALLLDRLSQSFGLASPRSLAELEQEQADVTELGGRLGTYASRWQDALDDLRTENLLLFLEAHPEWTARLEPENLAALSSEGRRTETTELLSELAPFTEAAGERYARLRKLRWQRSVAKRGSYRAEVKLAVLLRMQKLLTEIAGRVYLERRGSREETSVYTRLAACENLAFGTARPPLAAEPPPSPEPLPSLAEERQWLAAITPAWLGIQYRPLEEGDRKRNALPAGAVVVTAVLPDSPAAAADLRVSDVLIGPPDAPFRAPHAIRAWVLGSEVGTMVSLRVMRGAGELEVELELAAHPAARPEGGTESVSPGSAALADLGS